MAATGLVRVRRGGAAAGLPVRVHPARPGRGEGQPAGGGPLLSRPGVHELVGILREFTQRLFGGAARRAGKRTWCEKTPFNLLSVPFLLELFPSATVVVIMRHPVQVAASHLDQPWAPSTLDGVLNWLQPVYQRWLAQRTALLADRRYAEVKAEDLAAHWPDARRRLFERLGLPDAETSSTFSASRLTSRHGEPSDAGQAEIVSRLGWAAEELGYQAIPRSAPDG